MAAREGKMSHRKFCAPRHESLGFLPQKHSSGHCGEVKSFPKGEPSKPLHFTFFIGYKTSMSHIMRKVDRPESKAKKKEGLAVVTIVETPITVVVDIVGYGEIP